MKNKLLFTLLELLITIAIISILASMLLPTLSKVKEKGLAIDCTSNLKQLSLSNLLYTDDNRGFLVPFSTDGWDFSNGNKQRWHGVSVESSNLGESNSDYDPAKGPLAQYLGISGKLNACKGVKFPEAIKAYEKGCGGYGYNEMLGKLSDEWDQAAHASGYKLSKIKINSDKVMFADSAVLVGSDGQFSSNGPFFGPSSSIAAPGGWILSPTMHFRHQKRANISFADGHVTDLPLVSSAQGANAWQLGHPYPNNNTSRDKHYDPAKF
ncbi:MAG: prepilin-type N-terminal cleavage/methylation domain-containing protein [Victivallaceae bacterium]|nr:prepilin-type N-terminal cleavage/methylation domain-containing protein [Victivallaceae bacterium]MDD4180559.1 prepilin-type N-terminal cleavage/methylation domain-containing protein [Victivallaceae bacterium]